MNKTELRDQFALEAMKMYMQQDQHARMHYLANDAYRMADFMLEAREKTFDPLLQE